MDMVDLAGEREREMAIASIRITYDFEILDKLKSQCLIRNIIHSKQNINIIK